MKWLGGLQKAIVAGVPYWIRSGFGGAFLQSLGFALDTAQATLLHGLRQTRPGVCFEDALKHLQDDRGIIRRGTEPMASHRLRLKKWRQIWRHTGSHYGQMLNLQPYFLPGARPMIRTVHQSGVDPSTGQCHATWHTFSPDGSYEVYRKSPSNWQWDTQPLAWSRFWVIIYVDSSMLPAPIEWDGGEEWDGGAIWDGYFTAAQIADIVDIINERKAAHSKLAGVIFATDPASFDPTQGATLLPDGTTSHPDGNWRWLVDPVDNHLTRLQSAIYAFDDGDPEV